MVMKQKQKKTASRAAPSPALPSVEEPAVYTIQQFLKAHDISYGKFYQMCKEGKGPRMMRYGVRKVVSREEAARWRAALTR